MSLPRKKSRIILLDSIAYRWLVSPNDGYVVLVAQKEGVNGRIIEVYCKTDIHSFWVEFPKVDSLNLKMIKPKDAASIIRQALQLGWNPDEKGNPLVYDLVDDKVVKRQREDH